MSDLLSSGGALGTGLMNYLSAISANENARKQNATTDKWGPLLALNTHGGGTPQTKVPSASFAQQMGPALASMINIMGSSSVGGSPEATSGVGPVADPSQYGAMLGGMAGGGKVPGNCNPWKYAMGGMTMPPRAPMIRSVNPMKRPAMPSMPRYASGGQMGDDGTAPTSDSGGSSKKDSSGGGLSSLTSLLPLLAMLASDGGKVPGTANVPGDSPLNDNKLIAASPGEIVLPRSVSQAGMNGKKWKVAAYLNEVKKHGPGPLPVKDANKPTSSSMSPWAAMCSGGGVR
jgi:hypothetical protein